MGPNGNNLTFTHKKKTSSSNPQKTLNRPKLTLKEKSDEAEL